MRRLSSNFQKYLKQKSLTQGVINRFGGAPAGEVRPEDVRFNQFNYLKDTDSSLSSLNGFEDAHVIEYPDDTDPYAHLRQAPFFSFARLYFSDPYYHDDAHEPLMNEPHGYVTNDDPLDNRNNVERSYMEYVFYFTGALMIGLTLGYQGVNLRGHSTDMFDANITAELIEDQIREIRVENDQLLKKKQELLDQLNE